MAILLAKLVFVLPKMRDLIFGTLFLVCPYAAPIFPLREKTEDNEAFLEKALIYRWDFLLYFNFHKVNLNYFAFSYPYINRRGVDGSLESEHDYKLRQIDYITFFAALLRSGEMATQAYLSQVSDLQYF